MQFSDLEPIWQMYLGMENGPRHETPGTARKPVMKGHSKNPEWTAEKFRVLKLGFPCFRNQSFLNSDFGFSNLDRKSLNKSVRVLSLENQNLFPPETSVHKNRNLGTPNRPPIFKTRKSEFLNSGFPTFKIGVLKYGFLYF